ncbi:MAG: isoamylase early set domain-containing protein [Deltaproteobacteria bacterium]|nr:isoamylase early set domain-containing protein [Deltaproteobacteria bacterium]
MMKRRDQLELMRRRLDDELPPGSAEARELEALCQDPARAAELAALERLAVELGALRTPVPDDGADFVARVMRRLPDRVPARRSALGWLTRPFALRVTPALGLAALGILVATGVLISRLAGPRPQPAASSASVSTPPAPAPVAPLDPGVSLAQAPTATNQLTSQLIEVRFMLSAPNARAVTLVGDFNDWRGDELTLSDPDHDGVWTLTLPLPPGRHAYQFVVDGGEGRPDPNAVAVPDGFGGQNSVLTI